MWCPRVQRKFKPADLGKEKKNTPNIRVCIYQFRFVIRHRPSGKNPPAKACIPTCEAQSYLSHAYDREVRVEVPLPHGISLSSSIHEQLLLNKCLTYPQPHTPRQDRNEKRDCQSSMEQQEQGWAFLTRWFDSFPRTKSQNSQGHDVFHHSFCIGRPLTPYRAALSTPKISRGQW